MYRSVAAKILNNLRSAYTHNHTWIEVNPNSFRHLSHKFYNETQKVLENLGFSFLADIENEYLKNRTPDPRTFIRVMTTRDGVINAGFYQIKPNIFWRMGMFFTGIRNTKIIEFQSELENGYQVVTTTAKSDFSLPSSPKLNRNHESPETPIDSLYRKHEETLSRVQSHMNVKPARNESLQDILEFENRQMMIQKEYLESIGWVTKDYLLKQGIRDEKMAQEICDEIQEILVEEERAVS